MMTNKIEMKSKYAFDPIYDRQKLFRKILEAFANPGRILDITPFSNGFSGASYPSLLAIAEVLLDAEVSFAVLEEEAALAVEIHSQTGGQVVALEDAQYVFVCASSLLTKERIASLRQGDIDYPERSATVLVLLEEQGLVEITPQGPGIKEEEPPFTVQLEEEARRILAVDRSLNIPFPCGCDYVFLRKNEQMYAFPRTTKVKEFR